MASAKQETRPRDPTPASLSTSITCSIFVFHVTYHARDHVSVAPMHPALPPFFFPLTFPGLLPGSVPGQPVPRGFGLPPASAVSPCHPLLFQPGVNRH